MITTNIDVTDGLTNGAMGTVTNVVNDERTGKMSTIFISFDSNMLDKKQCKQVFIKVQTKMLYQCIKHRQHFPYTKNIISSNKNSVSTNTCLGCYNTQMSSADMTPAKVKFKPGEAYVVFSRVRTIEKLHIINYTQNQIHVSEHVEEEMKSSEKTSSHKCHQIYFRLIQEVWNYST